MTAIDDHGGSLERARSLFPGAPEPFVDLSTGISPHPYPQIDLAATALSRLPEPGRLIELKRVAARCYGATDARAIVAAPGTQILLHKVMALVAPGQARVLGPTYAEHARAATLAGHAVRETACVEDLADADVAIAVNPNNPDGRIVPRETLLDLADAAAARGGLLVVDEAFMDVGPAAESLCADAGRDGLVVLRSFGKFFGLAGLRLGFALGPIKAMAGIEAEFGPWAVSGPTLDYGLAALADTDWQETHRRRLVRDAERIDRMLAGAGVPVQGGTALFRFVDMAEAPSLFDWLGRRGILVRRFGWRSTALRIGLPGPEEEWVRLHEALSQWAGRGGDRETGR